MKKILFSDMDGTVIDLEDVKHPRDAKMFKQLQQQGHIVAFNTGRNEQQALFCTTKHHFTYDYLILNNGAHILDQQGRELFKKVIPEKVGKAIIEYCLPIENIWIFFYSGHKTFGYYQGQTYEHTVNGAVALPEYDFIEEYQKVKEFDIIAINQDNQQIDVLVDIQKYIEDTFGKDARGCLNLHYLDITASSCSKGSGVETLKEILKEEVETYCVGDSFNDISMFKACDHAYTFTHVDDEIAKNTDKQVQYVYEVIEDMLK